MPFTLFDKFTQSRTFFDVFTHHARQSFHPFTQEKMCFHEFTQEKEAFHAITQTYGGPHHYLSHNEEKWKVRCGQSAKNPIPFIQIQFFQKIGFWTDERHSHYKFWQTFFKLVAFICSDYRFDPRSYSLGWGGGGEVLSNPLCCSSFKFPIILHSFRYISVFLRCDQLHQA